MSNTGSVRTTSIFCDENPRTRWWPKPLASDWSLQYPGLFDFDDIRQANNQPDRHFYEWYAAIHIFQRNGSISMVEKAAYWSNPVKYERYINLVPLDTRKKLDALTNEHRVQLLTSW
jgi:hypothetical protein